MKPARLASLITLDKAHRFARMASQALDSLVYSAKGLTDAELDTLKVALEDLAVAIARIEKLK